MQSNKNSFNSLLTMSIGMMVISFFFVGSLYTRVKFLEKELDAYKNVTGVVEKVNQNSPSNQPTGNNIPEIKGEVKLVDDDHVNGERNARILLFEYSDLECPYCKRFHPTAQQIVDTYKGQVAWVYRHLPLAFHANAKKEAEASECANELGGNLAFWDFLDALFIKTTSGGTGIALSDLPTLATEIGLNKIEFVDCLENEKYAQRVKRDMDTAALLGVNGTPGNIILDTKTGKTKLMPGAYPYEDFKKAIDEMLVNN